MVNVTELESSEENTCGRVLTLVASDSLHGTVLQCIATGYSRHGHIFSLAVALALEGMCIQTFLSLFVEHLVIDCSGYDSY